MEAHVKEHEDENDYVVNHILREQSSPVRTMILINHDDGVTMCFAQGCRIFFCERTNNVSTELQVFPENVQITKIHNYNSNRLLVLGKSMARIVYVTYTNGHPGLENRWKPKLLNNVLELGEWTKAAAFLNDTKIACLNACNNLKTYNLKKNELQDIELERSSSYNLEVTEIYTGEIYVKYEEINGEYKSKMQDVVVCAGTVFGQVYIWTIDYNDKAKILYLVNAHEGPVYSIGLYPGGLTAAGDDRAGSCYRFSMDSTNSKPMDNIVDNANQCRLIKSRFDVYGHQARVYQGLLAAPWLITSSEDSYICLWRRQHDDEDSWVLQKKMVSGAGSPVRTLVYDEIHNLLYIGADNGSVQVWNISSSLAMPIDIVQLYPGEKDSFNNDIREKNWGNPKSVVAWSSKVNVAIIEDKRTAVILRQLDDVIYAKIGLLKGWDKNESGKSQTIQLLEAWDDHKCDNPFSMGFSPKRKYFASGSTEFGEVAIREALSDPFQFRIISYDRFEEQICSLVWASESICILSTSKGVYKANLTENNSETQAEWKSLKISNSVIIAAAVLRDFIVLGDEKGVLTVLKKTGEILNIYNKWHSEFGLSSLISYNGRIISTGRDSLVKFFTINNDGEITDCDVIRTPFDWIDRTVHFFDDLLCSGFKETKFMLFSMKAKEVVYEVDCGGAHRSYDFIFHYADDDDHDFDYELDTSTESTTGCTTDAVRISLSYIRDAKINRITDQLCNWLNPVKKASVTKKINCGVAILAEDKESYFVITGSDDNVITIFEYVNESSTLCLRQDLTGHVSSVVCLKYVACAHGHGRSGGLLFSGGGRSELIVWRIKPGKEIWYRQLKCIQLMEHLKNSKRDNSNLDFRVLDIQVKILLGLYFIFASCSDGRVYVLYYDEDKRDLKKIAVLQPKLMHLQDKHHAITKIHLGQVAPSTMTFNVFGCCTSGHLIVWNFDATSVLNEYGYYDDQNILKKTVYKLSTFHTRLSSTPITAMLHLATTKEFVKLVLGYESGKIEIVDLHYEDKNQFRVRVDRLGTNETIHSSGILSIEYFHDTTKSLTIDSEEEITRGRFGTFIVSSVDQVVSIHHFDTVCYEMKSAIRDCQAFVFLPRCSAGIFLGDGLALFDNLELKLNGRCVLKSLDTSSGL